MLLPATLIKSLRHVGPCELIPNIESGAMKRFFKHLYVYLKPFLHWQFLISFGIAWMITNGWCYIFIVLGIIFNLEILLAVGLGYATFLYLPCTPEKLVTIPIAIWLHT